MFQSLNVHIATCHAQDADAEWECHGFRTGEDQAWCRTVGVDGCTEYKAYRWWGRKFWWLGKGDSTSHLKIFYTNKWDSPMI